MFNSKISTIRQQGRLLLIGAIASAYLLGCRSTSPAPVIAGPPYWHTIGTVNHALQNDLYDGPQMINEVDLQTNLTTRVRILSDGQISVNPISGTATGFGAGQFATMMVQGGDRSSFAGYAVHPGDWGNNIGSYVNRPLSKAYVVNQNGQDKFYVVGQGWLYANGAWFASDRHLKSDIQKIPHALDRVMKLQGVTFQWKEEDRCEKCPIETSTKLEHRTEMGLIAQDVEKVVPEVVRTTVEGTKALAYQNLVALLIESIKTQQAQLDELAREIGVLQTKVNEQQKD